LDIVKAKLKINDTEKEITVDPNNKSADIIMKLDKGLADVQTWFYTSNGDTLGAYYVNVRLLE
jgi:hypothetical protein